MEAENKRKSENIIIRVIRNTKQGAKKKRKDKKKGPDPFDTTTVALCWDTKWLVDSVWEEIFGKSIRNSGYNGEERLRMLCKILLKSVENGGVGDRGTVLLTSDGLSKTQLQEAHNNIGEVLKRMVAGKDE